MSQSEADSGFTRLASLIEDIGADRYGHPLMAALHLCNDLAAEINRLRSERPAIPEGMEDLIRWVSEHPHPTEPISRVQMYRGDWTKLVAFLRAMLAAAPLSTRRANEPRYPIAPSEDVQGEKMPGPGKG